MNEDHQFNLSVDVVIGGKNFGKKKAKMFWFNSVRCAELFLMQNGYCRHKSLKPIGSGERLLSYLDGPNVTKRGRASKRAKELVWGATTTIRIKGLVLQIPKSCITALPITESRPGACK
jgi:hypothetical protein